MCKKMFIVIILLVLLSGCGRSWKNDFEISKLQLEENYIVGKIKNKTDKAYNLTIHFDFESGTLTNEDFCYEKIKPNETKGLKCLVYDIDDSYEIKIKDITYEEFKIPTLKYGEIEVDVLEYYFEDIYNSHTLNAVGLFHGFSEDLNYPYIDSVEYSLSNQDQIIISYKTVYEKSTIYITEYYYSENQELNHMLVNIVDSTEELENKIKTRISISPVLADYYYKSDAILTSLNKEVEEGYCWKTYNWCISSKIEMDELLGRYAQYSISLNEN